MSLPRPMGEPQSEAANFDAMMDQLLFSERLRFIHQTVEIIQQNIELLGLESLPNRFYEIEDRVRSIQGLIEGRPATRVPRPNHRSRNPAKTAFLDHDQRTPTPEFHCLPLNVRMRIVYKNVTGAQDCLELFTQDALPPRFDNLETRLIQIEAALCRANAQPPHEQSAPEASTSRNLDVSAEGFRPCEASTSRYESVFADVLTPCKPTASASTDDSDISPSFPEAQPQSDLSDLTYSPPGTRSTSSWNKSDTVLGRPGPVPSNCSATPMSLEREALAARLTEVLLEVLESYERRPRHCDLDPSVNHAASTLLQANPNADLSQASQNSSSSRLPITTRSEPTTRYDPNFFPYFPNLFGRPQGNPTQNQSALSVGRSLVTRFQRRISELIESAAPNQLPAPSDGLHITDQIMSQQTVLVIPSSLGLEEVNPDPVPSNPPPPPAGSAASCAPSSMQIDQPGELALINDSDNITFLGINLAPIQPPLSQNCVDMVPSQSSALAGSTKRSSSCEAQECNSHKCTKF